METLFIIIAFIVGAFLGYTFCIMRWQPKLLLKLTKIQSEVLLGEISYEDAMKEIEKIDI
jgi:uncharacterized membrane-anchored protein YhcB (DUF1043 family)